MSKHFLNGSLSNKGKGVSDMFSTNLNPLVKPLCDGHCYFLGELIEIEDTRSKYGKYKKEECDQHEREVRDEYDNFVAEYDKKFRGSGDE